MNQDFKAYLLQLTGGRYAQETEVIQSLWSGYGKIARYQLDGTLPETVVVKHISGEAVSAHPRGWNTDRSHQRKVKSYEVESHWYRHWGQQCGKDCKIPSFLGTYSQGNERWIVMEDLNAHFPLRKSHVTMQDVHACLQWLAYFHATFMGQRPTGLWEVGTYWHLATRPDEWQKMQPIELKEKAAEIDRLLNECRYPTIVHGDAKLANFCFARERDAVAAVDFQYVGGGCGMKDVAYFLGSCLTGEECSLYQKELLDFYFKELGKALSEAGITVDFEDLEQEWRSLYPVAIADFSRFLLGWMPTHQKVNDYHLDLTESVLLSLDKLSNTF